MKIVRYTLPPKYSTCYDSLKDTLRPPIYVLGLGRTHCATVCLLKDGEVIACASEERFNRIKNAEVFPTQAIRYVLHEAKISLEDLALIVYPYTGLDLLTKYRPLNTETAWNPITAIANKIAYRFPKTEKPLQWAYYNLYHSFIPHLSKGQNPSMHEEPKKELGVDVSSITTAADHHTCHAYAAYFGFMNRAHSGKSLVFVHDAEGDGLAATVFEVENDRFKRLSVTPSRHSLATLYGMVTKHLGMKMNEHEYKVMGLAPYASEYEVNRVLPLLKDLIWINPTELTFHSKVGSGAFPFYLKEYLAEQRFDGIAGALQKLVEDLVVSWVRASINKSGIGQIACGGGLFMNVKANKKLIEMPEVEEVYPCPGATDESTAIGAAYWGYEQLCERFNIAFEPKAIKSLYLGPEFTEREIETALEKYRGVFTIQKFQDPEQNVAELLSKGHIVARLSGRMEWGARALGNRSILANPSNSKVIRILNDQIKSRDFWMPFAATILAERQHDYLVNPKKILAPFMTLSFDTTELGREHLKAAIHPYDYTCRPQILERFHNESYYNLIKHFEKITGIGAVLNTSFNLHGEPIVCTPQDALSTFERSSLRFLVVGSYIVSKSSADIK